MKIISLTLKNFRCFREFNVDFHTSDEGGGLTVLVAKNGEGKTATLDAINIAWGTFIGAMPETKGAGFKPTDVCLDVTNNQMAEIGRPELEARFFLESPQNLCGVDCKIKRNLTASEKKPTTAIKDARPLTDYAKKLLAPTSENITWPVIAYYGDSRLWSDVVLTRSHISQALARSRKYGYADATNPKSGYKDFTFWFAAIAYSLNVERNNQERKRPFFDGDALKYYEILDNVVKSALCEALKPSGWEGVDCDGVRDIFAWKQQEDGVKKIAVSNLSAGVKIVIGLVADVAYRCCKLNPHLKNKTLEETPGIVLIDEIDLHLHPAWQQCILPILRKIFPKIQFIVSTHSPQVVSSVPKECVRILSDGAARSCENQTQGVESQNVLSEVFGTGATPENDEFVVKLNDYASLEACNEADSPEGALLYEELVAHYGESYFPLKRIVTLKNFAARRKKESERDA